jgi:hypothetical protein
MIRWMKNTWHSTQVLGKEGRPICTAVTVQIADEMVKEHNALLDCVSTLNEAREVMHWLADQDVDNEEWSEGGFGYEMVEKITAVLEKLK